MAYNVSSIKVLRCEAWMHAADVAELLATYENNLPGSCFLFALGDEGPDADGKVALDAKSFAWSSDWSGNSWAVLIEHVGPKIHGTVEAIVTWEGGDSHGGLRICDGKVTEPAVVMALAEEPQ